MGIFERRQPVNRSHNIQQARRNAYQRGQAMVNTFDPDASSVARATINAEIDRIVENFGKSLLSCNKAAELLITEPGRERRRSHNLELEQHCSMFRGASVLANRSMRGRT
jgi:hypothetical protein